MLANGYGIIDMSLNSLMNSLFWFGVVQLTFLSIEQIVVVEVNTERRKWINLSFLPH